MQAPVTGVLTTCLLCALLRPAGYDKPPLIDNGKKYRGFSKTHSPFPCRRMDGIMALPDLLSERTEP